MKETTNYKMDLEKVMTMIGINDTRYIKRNLESRYRVSAKRIWIESNIVTIYNPTVSTATKRLLKDGWKTC